jgi:hypothetical protein
MDGRIFSSAEEVQRPLYEGTDWCRGYLFEGRVNKSVKGALRGEC